MGLKYISSVDVDDAEDGGDDDNDDCDLDEFDVVAECGSDADGGDVQKFEANMAQVYKIVITPFFRTAPLFYHKFGNMAIFRSRNLYSLCSPGKHY